MIPLQIIYSFHDQEREEGASALSFFGSRTPSFLKIAENRKATTPFSLRSTEIFFEAAVVFGSKSCRNSQSDHFVISATAPLFDLQSQVSCPTSHAPRTQDYPLTTKGCKGLTQETCKAYHPQTNIEARLKGAEPRKKKHNY